MCSCGLSGFLASEVLPQEGDLGLDSKEGDKGLGRNVVPVKVQGMR